jgi:hypothetical protein
MLEVQIAVSTCKSEAKYTVPGRGENVRQGYYFIWEALKFSPKQRKDESLIGHRFIYPCEEQGGSRHLECCHRK